MLPISGTYIGFAQREGWSVGLQSSPTPTEIKKKQENSLDLGHYFLEGPFQKWENALQSGHVVSKLTFVGHISLT